MGQLLLDGPMSLEQAFHRLLFGDLEFLRDEASKMSKEWWSTCNDMVSDIVSDITTAEAGLHEGGRGLEK